MRLIIVRHGETEENLNEIIQGHLSGKLTEKGIEQAKKLAERLRNEKIEVIFSSDLARTKDIVKEILNFRSKIPVYFVEELRERFHGNFEGKRKKEIEGWETEKNREKIILDSGSETIEELVRRAQKFKEKTFENLFGKNVLWVTYGGFMSALNASIFDGDCLKIHKASSPKNTAVTIIEFDENKKPKIVLINCTKHLED